MLPSLARILYGQKYEPKVTSCHFVFGHLIHFGTNMTKSPDGHILRCRSEVMQITCVTVPQLPPCALHGILPMEESLLNITPDD